MMRVGHHCVRSGEVYEFETPYGPLCVMGARDYFTNLRIARVAYVRRKMPLEELVDFACGIVRSDN